MACPQEERWGVEEVLDRSPGKKKSQEAKQNPQCSLECDS